MTTEREDITRPSPANEFVSVWYAQENVNKALANETRATFDLASTVSKSLIRTQNKVTALWIFATGGYVTGILGIILAVTR